MRSRPTALVLAMSLALLLPAAAAWCSTASCCCDPHQGVDSTPCPMDGESPDELSAADCPATFEEVETEVLPPTSSDAGVLDPAEEPVAAVTVPTSSRAADLEPDLLAFRPRRHLLLSTFLL